MKKMLFKISLLFVIMVAGSVTTKAQIFVKIRPVAPVVRMTIAPSPRHVWVSGEYVWRGDDYMYKEGYWAVPPRPGFRWIPGHWQETRRRGWRWIPGHWR